MKYASKSAFQEAAEKSWSQLTTLCHELSSTEFTRRTSSVGPIDWSPKDVCAHVHAWHRLLLGWHREGLTGVIPKMPTKEFNWRQTPELNRNLYLEFRDVAAASVMRRLKLSHGRVMKIATSLSEEQLMKPGHFEWTAKLALISYVSINTDSHYRWAVNKIKKLRK